MQHKAIRHTTTTVLVALLCMSSPQRPNADPTAGPSAREIVDFFILRHGALPPQAQQMAAAAREDPISVIDELRRRFPVAHVLTKQDRESTWRFDDALSLLSAMKSEESDAEFARWYFVFDKAERQAKTDADRLHAWSMRSRTVSYMFRPVEPVVTDLLARFATMDHGLRITALGYLEQCCFARDDVHKKLIEFSKAPKTHPVYAQQVRCILESMRKKEAVRLLRWAFPRRCPR